MVPRPDAMRDNKLQTIRSLEKILTRLRKARKKIVLCHGVFDLLHPGHILHFQAARRHGDVLVVTLTPDRYVNKGPGRPVFHENLRAASIAALECVDYVALNEWPTAVETIRRLRPHVYAKGEDYADPSQDVTGRIREETAAVREVGGKAIFTHEQMFSSTSLINRFFSPLPEATRTYLYGFRKRYSMADIQRVFREMSRLRVLVVGEAILDQYCYCLPMAKSPKETIVASRFVSEESFAGGSLAIANHLSGFCRQVTLAATAGDDPRTMRFFRGKLRRNVQFHPIPGCDRPAVTKRRYLEPNFLTKMFEIQYLDDSPLPAPLERRVVDLLRPLLPRHDLVIVADYGHGLFTERIRQEISALAPFLCVNTQTNSANYGFNLATKYQNMNYLAVDEPEMHLALHNKYGQTRDLAVELRRRLNCGQLLVSRGPNGSIIVFGEDQTVETPAFATKVVDRIGAGDALFALTSPAARLKVPPDLLGFIGNCAGGLAVGIVCNREPIDYPSLMKFMEGLLK